MKELDRRALAVRNTQSRFEGQPFDWARAATCIHLVRFHARQMGHRVPTVPRFRSALTARRDYSAVRIKYPFDFDPTNIPAHREQLLKDCKSTHTAGYAEVASGSNNSAITIDGATPKP